MSDKTSRWGLSCFISHNILSYINNVNCDLENHIIITLKHNHRIFGSYIPPADSIYYLEEYFYNIINFILSINSASSFIGGGDLNSRLGNSIKSPSKYKYRENPDTVMNSHGRFLVDLCKSCKCFVLNNLTCDNRIFDGKFTFCKGGRKSQNDICISNSSGLENIKSFNIHDLSFNFSDHSAISCDVELKFSVNVESNIVSADLSSNAYDRVIKRQKKIQCLILHLRKI